VCVGRLLLPAAVGDEMELSSTSSLIAASGSGCLTCTVAVCSVFSSWWWTERPSETFRAFYKNKYYKTSVNDRVVSVNSWTLTLQIQLVFRYGNVFDYVQSFSFFCQDMAGIMTYIFYLTSGIWRSVLRYTCTLVLGKPAIIFSRWTVTMTSEGSFKALLHQLYYWIIPVICRAFLYM